MITYFPSKHFAAADGRYLGAFGGFEERDDKTGKLVRPPVQPKPTEPGALEVPRAPADTRQVWDGAAWVWPPALLAATRTADAKAILEDKLAAGWRDGAGVVWPLGATDQLNVIAVIARLGAGKGLPGRAATLGKADKAGQDRALDAAGWTALGVGMSDRIAALVTAYKAHAGALAAIAADAALTDAAKRAALTAHDIAAGWPA